MTNIDLSSLFERQHPPTPYSEESAEFDAVALRHKGMVVHAFPRTDVEENDVTYAALVRLASDRGLLVVSRADPRDDSQVYVFVVSSSEVWRVPAYLAFQDAVSQYPKWNDACNYLQTRLIGYSYEDTARWMKHLQRTRAGGMGLGIFMLLAPSQMRALEQLGMRAFSPTSDIELFWHRETGVNGEYVLRGDAATLLPDDLQLGRVSINGTLWTHLFKESLHHSPDPVLVAMALGEHSGVINRGLCSTIEILSKDGVWMDGAARLNDGCVRK